MDDFRLQFVAEAIAHQHQNHRWRSLTPIQPLDAVRVQKGEQTLINFSANDYLGLSKHPALMQAAQDYTARYGTGSTASRLVSGTYDIHTELEAAIATAVGQEASLLFNSGFQTNVSVLATLADRHSLVVCDRRVHNSLIQGILLSRATFKRYRHNDLNHLEMLLKTAQQRSYNRVLIVSETVFSMDGDRADVAALTQLAEQYGAILYLDDAHALGVLGRDGTGLAAHQPRVDVVVGTFGKACGAFGAFVACSSQLRDYLVNFCPGLIYTTALPPSVIGTVLAALKLIHLSWRRSNDRIRSRIVTTDFFQKFLDFPSCIYQILLFIIFDIL
ncbi:MAG: 8-amino-7-oxononanoate synthase, partial [Cyanothece sp. SIO2G6]|nr:8-amino-7-oxononanoate synthase [Cyanothece sp. SIO2G6]